MNRREFLGRASSIFLTPTILAMLEAGCRISGLLPEPDIILDGGPDDAKKIEEIYGRVEEMVKNPAFIVRIGLMDESGEIRVLSLFRRQDSNNITVYDEETGAKAVLGFGSKLLIPSIKFMDEKGETLRDKDGDEMEYALFGPGTPSRLAPTTATDWFAVGIKIAAVGLGIFLAAKIIGLVLAAVAFIAYYAMILALIVAGIAFLSKGAKWLLGATGWSLDSVKDFFGKKTDEIRDLIANAAESF